MAGRRTTTTGRGRRETAAARRGDAGTGNLGAGVGCGAYIEGGLEEGGSNGFAWFFFVPVCLFFGLADDEI